MFQPCDRTDPAAGAAADVAQRRLDGLEATFRAKLAAQVTEVVGKSDRPQGLEPWVTTCAHQGHHHAAPTPPPSEHAAIVARLPI